MYIFVTVCSYIQYINIYNLSSVNTHSICFSINHHKLAIFQIIVYDLEHYINDYDYSSTN